MLYCLGGSGEQLSIPKGPAPGVRALGQIASRQDRPSCVSGLRIATLTGLQTQITHFEMLAGANKFSHDPSYPIRS